MNPVSIEAHRQCSVSHSLQARQTQEGRGMGRKSECGQNTKFEIVGQWKLANGHSMTHRHWSRIDPKVKVNKKAVKC